MELQLEHYLRQIEGGEEVIAAQKRELSRRPETRAARDIREEDRLMWLEQQGVIRRGSGKLGNDFWDLPRPQDPTGSVRQALEEDRKDRF